MHKASFWDREADRKIRCRLCPHNCLIQEDQSGVCGMRKNLDGELAALTYGQIAALNVDPIEKKPLYHFHPGGQILSVGTYGCNFSCAFCQNWHLVDNLDKTVEMSPPKLLAKALSSDSLGVAFTYNEPLIWFEYLMDTAPLLKENGLAVVLVTNGFIEQDPLEQLLPYVDAMNIDLKSIHDDYYKRLCKGRLAPVKRTIELAVKTCHVEITNLLVTQENDSLNDIRKLVEYIASVDPQLPLHFSRYFPNRNLTNPPTPPEVLQSAYEIGREMLHYVYLGNFSSEKWSNTYCPQCNSLLIKRTGYRTEVVGLKGDKCKSCGHQANVIV